MKRLQLGGQKSELTVTARGSPFPGRLEDDFGVLGVWGIDMRSDSDMLNGVERLRDEGEDIDEGVEKASGESGRPECRPACVGAMLRDRS